MITRGLFLDNQALGGAGGSGATGGVGADGAIAKGVGFGDLVLESHGLLPDTSSLTLDRSTLIPNVALGGNGLGGGLFADPDTTAAISNSSLDLNQAIGGAGFDGGDGSGGGIYVTSDASVSLKKTKVSANYASTSNNNIYGTGTYL